jgi:hypothetical protein
MRETADLDGAPNFKGGLLGSLPSCPHSQRMPSHDHPGQMERPERRWNVPQTPEVNLQREELKP